MYDEIELIYFYVKNESFHLDTSMRYDILEMGKRNCARSGSPSETVKYL